MTDGVRLFEEDYYLFNSLEKCEQDSVLRFARAYMRVREFGNDKTLHISTRVYYNNLEAKLVKHLEGTDEE